jgi:hypothetical protein
MKRLLVVAAVALLAGCATGVDDPQPTPAPPTKEHAPPVKTFSATDVDNSTIDPAQINGNPATNAPKPDLEFNKPVPTNGEGTGDEDIETDLTANDLKTQ